MKNEMSEMEIVLLDQYDFTQKFCSRRESLVGKSKKVTVFNPILL